MCRDVLVILFLYKSFIVMQDLRRGVYSAPVHSQVQFNIVTCEILITAV